MNTSLGQATGPDTWPTSWQHLLESEKCFYMEFYAPIEDNLKVMPDNNDLISSECYLPNDGQLNYVLDRGDNLVRSIGSRLNDGQRNAIIFWIEEHVEFMQHYMGGTFDILGDHPEGLTLPEGLPLPEGLTLPEGLPIVYMDDVYADSSDSDSDSDSESDSDSDSDTGSYIDTDTDSETVN